MPPAFLSLAQVLDIHQDQIARYGGEPGTRDINLLKSALGMPSMTFDGQFLHTDLFEMAAAYLYHLTKNHPFVDGNKRVGAMAAYVFLLLNGYELDVATDELVSFIMQVAQGKISKAEIALFIRDNSNGIKNF